MRYWETVNGNLPNFFGSFVRKNKKFCFIGTFMTGSHLGYDGPGSGMYKFLYKSPAPRKVQLKHPSQDLCRVG